MNILILLLLVVIEITIIFKKPKDKSDDDVSETLTGARAYRMRGLFHLIIGCVSAVVSSVLRRFGDAYIPDSISDKIWIAIYIMVVINLVFGIILMFLSIIEDRP